MTHRTFVRTLLASLFMLVSAAAVASDLKDVPTIWRLLDYVAVDYAGAVKDGAVVSEDEYKEMVEFSNTARERIETLPATPGLPTIKEKAAGLQQAVADKQAPDVVASRAREAASLLIASYPVPIAPTKAPDLARGQQVYAEQCASCHGVTGAGDGPATVGAKLDPPPIAFTDEARARERSIFALYQVIEQGLDGTSMASFAETLSAQDRWAVAAYAGSLAYPPSAAAEGERVFKSDKTLRDAMTLGRLMSLRPAELQAQHGEAGGKALAAFLRHQPAAAVAPPGGRLTVSRDRLNEALAAYQAGNRKKATDLALSAYLDGFEPLEPTLAARDRALMVKIEQAMIAVRASIAGGAPADQVAADIGSLDRLFGEAETVLSSGSTSGLSTFLASFTILFREGLEALLIVVSMFAFLRKADRPEMVRWVHYGWVCALFAGAGTWALATWVITISGADRELTEGVGSLVAAVVLVWVGIWMHGKSHADSWQRYIRERMSGVLTGSSGYLLLALAFVVVYREVFETILFYAAIWNPDEATAVFSGIAAAVVGLLIIAWVMLRFSVRLPIGQFFMYASALMAALAVVLMGKAVSALQEAGYLPVVPLPGFPRIDLVGLYPTREGLAAQVVLAAVLVLGFLYNRWSARREA